MNFLKRLFERKPDVSPGWLIEIQMDNGDAAIIAAFIGSQEEARDAANAAFVNWAWQHGAFEGGKPVLGHYRLIATTAENVKKNYREVRL